MDPSILNLIANFAGDVPSEINEKRTEGRRTDCHHDENEEADVSEVNSNYNVRVVIFSKDRPWQLQQLLRSMQLLNTEEDELISNYTVIYIIVNITSAEYRDAYRQVKTQFCKTVPIVWLYENNCHDSFDYNQDNMQQDVSIRRPLGHEGKIPMEDSLNNESCFSQLLERSLEGHEYSDMVMFLTDDMILLEPLHKLVNRKTLFIFHASKIWCILWRLHPGLVWSQTRDCVSMPPLEFKHHIHGFHTYAIQSVGYQSPEWSYMFDLSGGMYRIRHVVKLLQLLLRGTAGCTTEAFSHPNSFEMNGNTALQKTDLLSKFKNVAIPTHPHTLILALNRVQSICHAPLAMSDDEYEKYTPNKLLKLLKDNQHYDLKRYKYSQFHSSHIGKVYLKPLNIYGEGLERQTNSSPSKESAIQLSVLIPVRTGPPEAAVHSISSVLMQPVDEYLSVKRKEIDRKEPLNLSPMQIVIVDDSCIDGAVDQMIQSAKNVAGNHSFLHLYVDDHRKSKTQRQQILHSHQTDKVIVYIDLISCPSPGGIAKALNFGLVHCKSDLISRMDADDVCSPNRLITQIYTLRMEQKTDVLGMSSVNFTSADTNETIAATNPATNNCSEWIQKEKNTQNPSKKMEFSSSFYEIPSNIQPQPARQGLFSCNTPPNDAGFVSWLMLFSCVISHPSVMFRKSTIQKIGGYNESLHYAEDYDLWLRLSLQKSQSIRSLPRIGLWYRKHSNQGSLESKRKIQMNESIESRRRAILSIVNLPEMDINISDDVIIAMRCPSDATSFSVINDAAKLLCLLESTFLLTRKDSLSSHEVELIKFDCNERIRFMATIALSRFGSSDDKCDSFVWNEWSRRSSDDPIANLSLLINSK